MSILTDKEIADEARQAMRTLNQCLATLTGRKWKVEMFGYRFDGTPIPIVSIDSVNFTKRVEL